MALFAPKPTVGSTQAYLDFAEIRDDLIVMRDGSLRIILAVSSINFELKSEEEQRAIIAQFQSFLNALAFPIQILVQSKRLDLAPYLAKLRERLASEANDLLRVQIADYIEFIRRLVSFVNVMEKRFYLVVPYHPPLISPGRLASLGAKQIRKLSPQDFANYKEELRERASLIAGGLGATGLRAVQLGTAELVEFLYTLYNPGTASRQEVIAEAESVTAPVIEGAPTKES